MGFQPINYWSQEFRGLIVQFLVVKMNVLFKLDKVGFQPRNRRRQELRGLIVNFMTDESHY